MFSVYLRKDICGGFEHELVKKNIDTIFDAIDVCTYFIKGYKMAKGCFDKTMVIENEAGHTIMSIYDNCDYEI